MIQSQNDKHGALVTRLEIYFRGWAGASQSPPPKTESRMASPETRPLAKAPQTKTSYTERATPSSHHSSRKQYWTSRGVVFSLSPGEFGHRVRASHLGRIWHSCTPCNDHLSLLVVSKVHLGCLCFKLTAFSVARCGRCWFGCGSSRCGWAIPGRRRSRWGR